MASKGPGEASELCICSYVTQEGKEICVFKKDITKHRVNVIVNYAYRDLQLTKGLAAAIVLEGGMEIQSECDAFIKDNGGPLPRGRAIVTSSGNLPCDRIIHAVTGPKWSEKADNKRKVSKETKQESYLRDGLLNSLDSAKELRSIAIPGINSGDPAFPRDLCAKVILDAVLHFCKENPTCNLSEIHLTDNDDSTVMEFVGEMRRRFGKEDTFVDLELRRLTEELEGFKLEQRDRREHYVSVVSVLEKQVKIREQALIKFRSENNLELSRLRKEIERLEKENENFENRCNELRIEKESLEEEAEAMANETERILLDQGDSQQQFEIELESERNAKEEAEQHAANLQATLTATQNQVQELQSHLSVLQELKEGQQDETRDWVLSRDEIHLDNEVVGKGAWATVYRGKFRGCKVAVKKLHELILSSHNRHLLEREMIIASKCRHPCMLQFIGATNDDGNPLFVTELMESSLRTQVEKRALSEADVKAISLDVAQALNYLHLKKPSPIIHRDISSANVLLWRQGVLWRGKVSDYGTANFIRQTMTAGPGAPIYCAPEALTPNQTIKMDVYSFGALLCEMCIGELPDPQNREKQVIKVTDKMSQNIIRRCVKPEPEARPSMEEIINELEAPATRSLWSWIKNKNK